MRPVTMAVVNGTMMMPRSMTEIISSMSVTPASLRRSRIIRRLHDLERLHAMMGGVGVGRVCFEAQSHRPTVRTASRKRAVAAAGARPVVAAGRGDVHAVTGGRTV